MSRRDIVVIAASRGGFGVLRKLVGQLKPSMPAAIFVVLHIGRHKSVLPDLMRAWSPVPASFAEDGSLVEHGAIRVAPPDRHLVLARGRTWLNDGATENFPRPAADPLFRSASLEYGSRVVGVVLSGDLDDGAAGLAAIRARGGLGIVQDPQDCESDSMPLAALNAAGADSICAGVEIGRQIEAAVNGELLRKEEQQMSNPILEREAELALQIQATPEALDEIGDRSALTCPACGGALWRIKDDRPMRFRCHTGHAFGGLSLEEGYASRSEDTVWTAIRAVDERAIFARERRDWARRVGNEIEYVKEQARIEEAQKLAELLREALGNGPSVL